MNFRAGAGTNETDTLLTVMSAQTISLPVVKPLANADGVASREQIARDLSELIEGEVRFGKHERMLYATDASIYQVEPIGVVCPRNQNDVAAVVRYCAQHRLPILPRGGGTSLAGQTVNNAVVIDFSVYCRELLQIDVERRTARVQPGIVLDALNAELAKQGLMFGPDVATSAHANIGGMIGNNSAGAYSLLYGRTVEHLRGVEALLADGRRVRLEEGAAERDPLVRDITQRISNVIVPRELEIAKRFPKTIRHVDGYNLDLILTQLRDSTPGTFDRVNLAHLVCGSEGTLAVTVEAELNVVPAPRCTGLAIIGFAGVDEALRSLMAVLETKPAAVELIDDVVIGLAARNVEYCRYVDLLPKPPAGAAGAVLYVAYFADDPDQLNARFDEVRDRFAAHTINCCANPAEMAQAWKLRKAGEPLLHGLSGARKPITFIEDLAVNPEALADFVADFRALVARHGTTAAYYAHASVGCLHIRPLVSLRDPGDWNIIRAISEEATDLVLKYGGALSGEHGDGRVRSHLLERFYGKETCDAFRAVKAIFDPDHRMNPGNIVSSDPSTMLAHLRVRPNAEFVNVPRVKTYFKYDREHGFDEAVERCNGAGVCRKMKGGTMCPSYRATRDERHATRGRGNALRLAITGQFSADGTSPSWNDPQTHETLDLCLSCKACKSECPSNVDVAKLKAEYLAQGFARRGIPWRVKAFGRIRALNRIGSAIHPLANALARFAPIKSASQAMLRLHPGRELPRFERSLYAWMQRRSADAGRPAVILVPDCFTVYNEPQIGKATVLVLERLGYRVVLPRLGCCGRSLISTGMLAEAQRTCRSTAQALHDCMHRQGAVAIVGCEPSCVSAIKDDWLDLDMGLDAVMLQSLADRTFLVEQFVDKHWDQHPARITTERPADGTYILHGHCHQKALWGIETSSNALRRVLGDRLQTLDSGCCGMAGSFGYTRNHYDVSMKIGELSLFGVLRANTSATIIAPGTSCRQQIKDGVARRAVHPIEVLADAMNVSVTA